MFNHVALGTEFDQGREAANTDVINGDVYNVKAAIESFNFDRPDSPRQRGYLFQLIKIGN